MPFIGALFHLEFTVVCESGLIRASHRHQGTSPTTYESCYTHKQVMSRMRESCLICASHRRQTSHRRHMSHATPVNELHMDHTEGGKDP